MRFIAEIGVNHEGSRERARELIMLAASAGADIVKFQSYKAQRLARRDSPAYWDLTQETTKSQYDLFKRYDVFEFEDYKYLRDVAAEHGVEFMSTPFDIESANFLSELVDCYKISSSDITNYQLIETVASFKKPVILSTGASTIPEIISAVEILTDKGAKEVTLMHCILNYPTKFENAHLSAIQDLQRLFPDREIGYSDHTIPTDDCLVQITATILGASLIEKHFTNNKSLPGNDHYHSFDPNDLRNFKDKVRDLERIMKPLDWANRPMEESARRNARRSLVLARDVKAGSKLTAKDLTALRPADGIPADKYFCVLGKVVRHPMSQGELLSYDDLESWG